LIFQCQKLNKPNLPSKPPYSFILSRDFDTVHAGSSRFSIKAGGVNLKTAILTETFTLCYDKVNR